MKNCISRCFLFTSGITCFIVVDLSIKVTCACFSQNYLRNKRIYKLTETKLTIDVLDLFPVELTFGVISDGDINFFVHSSVHDRQKLNGPDNFGALFYEVISSPFILWKFYIDFLGRTVLNYCDKLIVPALLSGMEIECRNFNICKPLTCFGLKCCFSKWLLHA